jgi:hypothetical protein
MPENKDTSLPFESGEPAEQKLWAALVDLPRGEPSDQLRRRFYAGLEQASAPRWPERLRDWLGMKHNGGWITAAACLVLGFGFAQSIDRTDSEPMRLAALEQSLAQLQRELILDRLDDASANTRLKGVVDASQVVASDRELARALLARATQDRSLSVRSAAIDALGAHLGSEEIGDNLMALLEGAESPIVQLALVDLVLRHGDNAQIRQLRDLADGGRLHPDLVLHVNNALRSQSI